MRENWQFRRLRLSNWKNFRHADVAIRDRLFLTGANASGKSNFLDAFRFLRDLAASSSGFQQAVLQPRRGGVSGIRCLSANRRPDVKLAVDLERNGDAWSYEIAFHQDSRRRPRIRSERVTHGKRILVDRPDREDERDPERLTQTYLEQVSANQPFRELAKFFGSIHYLHLVPQLVREPDHYSSRPNDPFGSDFLERVANTQERTRISRLRHIECALRASVPQLERIELSRDMRGRFRLWGKYRHWRLPGEWQSEEQFSDGTLRLTGLLWAAMDRGGPLLLEEPELSLHPEVVRVLPQMFARIRRRGGRQIFVSTHAPDLLRDEGIGIDEAVLLMPGPKGTEAILAGSIREVRALIQGGLSLADIAMSRTRPENAVQLASFGDS